MNYNLQRFIEAQEKNYSLALIEITNGYKCGHWMWYVFSQVKKGIRAKQNCTVLCYSAAGGGFCLFSTFYPQKAIDRNNADFFECGKHIGSCDTG